ncbi:MAG: glycosyltransferase family 4 protein [Ilumatobacteraceae bacterium]
MTDVVLVSAPFSGIEVHFRLLAGELARLPDVRVEAIWLDHEPIRWRWSPLRWNWLAAAAWSTSRSIAECRRCGFDPDVAMLNYVNPVWLRRRRRRLPPVVLHLDTTPLITSSMGIHYLQRHARHAAIEQVKRRLYRWAFAVPRRIIAVSELVRDSLVDDYGVDTSLVTVIPYPVDTEWWTRRVGDEARAGRLRVLFVGADWARKGGDVLLAAARHPALRTCEFHVVTRHPVPDAPPNVVVHLDVTPGSSRLFELFESASVFALPTLADLSPIVLTEAMAMELPVVTTDVGAISELVADGEDGFVVAIGDAGSFAERLRELVESPELRARMGRRARATVVEERSLATAVVRYLDVIRSARPAEVPSGSA